MEQRGDGMYSHIKSMLENTQKKCNKKNADAFHTFSIKMSEEEFDWSADQCISCWISMIIPLLYFL